MGPSGVREAEAFTRLELAAVLAVLGLLTLLVLPSLANQRDRSTRLVCANDLRLIGQAIQQWGTEHGGRLPWRTPWCEGGTMPNMSACPGAQPGWFVILNNAWFQWTWISNEVRTPKVLACPSDAQKVTATTWDFSPSAGFLHPNFQNRAVSYLIGLDVFPEDPNGLVSGDRNVRFNGGIGNCSAGLTGVPGLISGPAGSFGIADGLHVEAGNYLFKDGRVEELSSRAFVTRWNATFQDDNGVAHYLVP